MDLLARARANRLLVKVSGLLPSFFRRRLADRRRAWLASLVTFPELPPHVASAPALQRVTSSGSEDAVFGANVFAFLRGQFGLGESARRYVEAMLKHDVPLSLHDVSLQIPHGQNDREFESLLGEAARFPVDLVFVNPDLFEEALDNVAALRAAPSRRHIVAVWFWELEGIPEAWLPAIEQVDEIIVASEFVERAFRRASSKRVTRVPLPLGAGIDSGANRADLGLEEEKFMFLSTFDFNSSVDRKNPFDVIAAFQAAFPASRDDVRLLVKTSNGRYYEDRLIALLRHVAADPRIIIRDGVLDRAHVGALQRCSDAYVSLHRAEGFGLGMAESMALGKPVIATGWSGNLEFMNARNSWLVDYELVPVPADAYPLADGQRWAQPSIEHAARCMREVVDDADLRQSRSARGKVDVSAHLSQESAAAIIRARLVEIGASVASSDRTACKTSSETAVGAAVLRP